MGLSSHCPRRQRAFRGDLAQWHERTRRSSRHLRFDGLSGSPKNSVTHAIKLSSAGSTFKVSEVKSIVQGLAASDAEHGYDGNLYFADYGGGWSVNKNGSIQVLALRILR